MVEPRVGSGEDCSVRGGRQGHLGVGSRSEPRKPMRSARVVSRVISTILGLGEAAVLGGAEVAVLAHAASNIAHNQHHGTRDFAKFALRRPGDSYITSSL